MLDRLEPRVLLSVSWEMGIEAMRGPAMELADVMKFIVAGDPNGTPTDSPTLRIDPNTTSSPYAGVGSVFMETSPGRGYIGSAAAITPTHILTAGHNVDLNDDGNVDVAPSSFRFILNFGGSITHQIFARTIHLNPQYTGFANPAVNDDMAIVELMNPLPAGVPIYPIYDTPFSENNPVTITLIGYGQSGYGTQSSYTVDPAFDVKRRGMNMADQHEVDDEGSGRVEVFEMDFDGGGFNAWGGGSLGNNQETTLGGGDSGGPSFVNVNGQLQIFGVNTYGFGNIVNGQIRNPPRFGSGSGGIVVSAYIDWINGIIGGGGGENVAPVANDDAAQTNNKGKVTINVLGNDSDANGDTLAIAATTNPANGTIVVNANGTITYTRNSGFIGTDTFTYAVTDGQLQSNFATVTVTVAKKGGGPRGQVTLETFSPDFHGFAGAQLDKLVPGSLFGDSRVGFDSPGDPDDEAALI
jgi:hypothetical protein